MAQHPVLVMNDPLASTLLLFDGCCFAGKPVPALLKISPPPISDECALLETLVLSSLECVEDVDISISVVANVIEPLAS
jgi:hypothetical protein